MRSVPHTIHTVAVALHLAGASCRDILNGISTYARENCYWRLRIFSQMGDFTPAALREIPNVDGIITCGSDGDGITDFLESISTPRVIIGSKGNWSRQQHGALAFVRNDDADIGRLAARHLHSLGKFRSFGFVPSKLPTHWSQQRENGYRDFLRGKSIPVSVYGRQVPLRDWLSSLPKPTALFAAYDECAVKVLAACSESGIRVPSQVSVIGVDNDELLCEFSDPPLSSIQPDHFDDGRVAAQELNRLLRKGKVKSGHCVLCRNKRLIVRESSAPIPPTTHLVNEILRYVENNATADLRAEDVVRHLGVSRRLVDLRLHESSEPPLSKLIGKARLEEVARRLLNTNLSVGKIAASCSFGNLQHLANAFRRHFGMTMTQYRAAGGRPSCPGTVP